MATDIKVLILKKMSKRVCSERKNLKTKKEQKKKNDHK